MKTNPDFGIITLSYAPDFERCKLLAWSVETFVNPPVKHYIIVDRKDVVLFKQLQKPNTEILTVESILPWWIKKISFFKNGWFNFKGLPIRNWMLQQIVKLAVAQFIEKDVLVFVDSDVTFVRPFNFQTFIQGDKIRLFRVADRAKGIEELRKWHRTASYLLGLPERDYPNLYIGNIITWRRDNVFKLYQYLEKVSGRGWIELVCSSWDLSEYILYGIFCEYILKEQSGHYYDQESICKEYWKTESLANKDLEKFFAEVLHNQISVMISAKAGISPQKYESLIKQIQ